MTYTEDQEDTLVTLNVVASVFSFIGASFIIGNYFLFEDLRSFAFKLVLFVAIGDLINCVGNFMGAPPKGFACDFQGFITQFGDLVSFGWVTAIAWTIYTVLTARQTPTPAAAVRWFKKMHVVIWLVCITLSLLPVTTGSYGPSGGLCWIQGEVGAPVAEAWRWLCFYLPLWGAIGYMMFVYYNVRNQLREPVPNTSTNNVGGSTDNVAGSSGNVVGGGGADGTNKSSEMMSQPSDEVVHPHESASDVVGGSSGNVVGGGSGSGAAAAKPGEGKGALQRMVYYPVVLFVCYFFATIRRLEELISGSDAPFELAAIQVFMSALLGTGNALVYGLSPVIRKRDYDYIMACFGKETNSDEEAKNTEAAGVDVEVR